MSISSERKGPGYWTFNASLTEDENYVKRIENSFEEWLEECSEVEEKVETNAMEFN